MSLTLPTTPNGYGLAGLCECARPALAALGDLGGPLLGVLATVEQAGRASGVEVLADPGFALDVLAQVEPGTDPALVGRVLDFLRSQTGATAANPPGRVAGRSRVTVADAVASYEAGALTLMAPGTQGSYRCWARRLADAHGTDDPDAITTGDLRDLIAQWVREVREHSHHAPRDGNTVEFSGVAAFRHLWGYLVEKGWARTNIAKQMRKPPLDDPLRRPFRAEEAAVIRHLARGLRRRDGLLSEVTICISERLGLRRIELRRLRNCDVDLVRHEMRVYGKGNKCRTMPIPPALLELLGRYMDSRRPTDVAPEAWARSEELFLRHRPDQGWAAGKPVGNSHLDRLFKGLREAAPEIFANGDLSQHCYRHALASFVDGRYGRAVTKTVLGHRGRKTSTDHYVHIPPETIREAICAYERFLLAADPTHKHDGGTDAGEVAA